MHKYNLCQFQIHHDFERSYLLEVIHEFSVVFLFFSFFFSFLNPTPQVTKNYHSAHDAKNNNIYWQYFLTFTIKWLTINWRDSETCQWIEWNIMKLTCRTSLVQSQHSALISQCKGDHSLWVSFKMAATVTRCKHSLNTVKKTGCFYEWTWWWHSRNDQEFAPVDQFPSHPSRS